LGSILVTALASITVTGCVAAPKPQQRVQVSNPDYQLDELFTDPRGYTVYRYDDGDSRYYVVGPNGAQMLPTTTTKYVTEANTVYVESGGGGHK